MDKYYVFIINNKIEGVGQGICTGEGLICLEITEEQYNLLLEKGNTYFVYDGEKIVLNPDYEAEQLVIAKENKHSENTTKAQEAIQNGYVVYKEAQFETNTQTCGDLTSTLLIMQATGMETYTWLSKDDKVVELTVEDIATLGGLIATYKNTVWNTKYVDYKAQIEQATTIEEVEAIIIDYDVPTML